MEPEAKLHEGAGESSSFGTKLELVGEPRTESTFSASNEVTGDMAEMPGRRYESSMEITPEIGRETYPLRPGIEFSTDLRMELSADVLASLGGSSNDVEKPHEDNLLEITSMREDMHFIPEIPLSPPPEPLNSSNGGNFTSVAISPQIEEDCGVYAPVGSTSSERYDCAVPASTVSDSELHPHVDPAIGTNEYPTPPSSVFENSASVPVEPPVDIVAFAASLSFPMTTIDTDTPEAVASSSLYDACTVSSGANNEPSDGDVPHPVPVSLSSRNDDTAAISALDATTAVNGFDSSLEVDRITASMDISTTSELEVVTANRKELTPSDVEKSSATPGTSSQGEACPQSEVVAGGSFSEVDHEKKPVVSEDPISSQDVPSYGLKIFDTGLFPLVPTLSQVESVALAEPELISLTSETFKQSSAPAEHVSGCATSGLPAVVPVEHLHVAPLPGFAQDPLDPIGNQVDSSRAALPNAPDQAVPLPSAGEVSELNQQPGLTGLPSPAPGFSAPSGNVPKLLDDVPPGPVSATVQSTPIHSGSITWESDAAAGLEPIFLSTIVLPGESETCAPSARPGHFWDVPSSSGRSLPSLPTLSAYFDGSRSPFRGRKTARRKKSSDSVVDGKGKNCTEMDKMEEVVELESMVEAQKKAMQWQIGELQRIMVIQCQLTGRNPLSEEMVYEVLGEKGAEKKLTGQPSPEALRHMREVFAIKDTITKKEAREISSMSGASVSQVRDFFAAQKILVKKFVQQVFDESGRFGIRNATEQSSNTILSNNIGVERDLGFHKLASVESVERYLELMRAERTFFGQIQLIQIILQTDAAAVILRRFLEKGGLKLLHQWLVEAAAEEQTSVLRQLLKALAHLPISSSVPHQMPVLVQNVNKLRFYQNLDISSQSRALLAMWSKMLKQKSEAAKPSGSVGMKSTAVMDKNIAPAPGGLKRNGDVVPGTHGGSGPRKKKAKEEENSQPESKVSGVSAPGSPKVSISTPAFADTTPPAQVSAPPLPPAKQRWSTTLQPSESAVAAVSVSRKRLASKSLGDHSKERRKVQLVEDTSAGKNLPSGVASKSMALTNSRPLSTDDIYKAKKLQRLLQEPLTKSRRKGTRAQEGSQAQELDPQAAANKELPLAQQQDVSRILRGSTPPPEHSSFNQRTLSASTAETGEVSRLGSLASRIQQEFYRSSVTPTSSPDRGPRIITPTSSPDRPQLIITPTPSPDRSQGFPKHTSPQGRPLSPEDKQHTVVTPTSDSSQELLQLAVVHDSTTRNSYRMSPSLTLELTADGSQVISPYSSNVGLIESVKRSEPPQQPTDVVSRDISPVSKEGSGVSVLPPIGEAAGPSETVFRDNLSPTTLANTQPAFVEPIQHSSPRPKQHFSPRRVREVQMYSIPSPTPPEENDINEAKQIVESTGSRTISKEPPVVDIYAALRANMIRWRIPPVYHLDPQWNVAAGEDSKEKEMQSARVKREEEAYYPDASSIPTDPKDPWEEEPNYDDSLTFEIYLDNSQRKPAAGMQIQTDHTSAPATNMMPSGVPTNSFTAEAQNMFSGYIAPVSSNDTSRKGPSVSGLDLLLQQLSGSGGVAHDPALLSLLLQNPDLVNQLTSAQAYATSGIINQNILAPPVDPLKQPSSIGSPAAGLRTGDIGLDRLGASNIPVAMVHPPQPARAAPSVTQVPSETMRVEDQHPHTGMGYQQNPGFVTQAGVDNRYPAPPQMQPAVGSTSGWEQARMAPPLPPLPPPPPLPPVPSGGNQVQQQANKVTNWPEPQVWNSVGAAVGRPPLNTAHVHSGQEQLHMRPQTIMTPNLRPPNYGGVVGIPQVEVNPVVSQQEMHNSSQRQWTNGSHLVIAPTVNDNAMIQAGQDSGVSRNNRWPRPPGPPPDSQMRPVCREYSEFQSSRQANVAENLGVWVTNDRGRPVPPPFQGGYRPPPPPPPPYPAPQQWHQTPERNVRPGPASAVPPFPLGRDLRPPQPQPPQPWHPNMGPPRAVWRGPQG